MRPCLTSLPMTNAAPAAPWSVPEPFSAGRRPNSLHSDDHDPVGQRRAARGRAQNARMLPAVASRLSRELRRLVGVRVEAALPR